MPTDDDKGVVDDPEGLEESDGRGGVKADPETVKNHDHGPDDGPGDTKVDGRETGADDGKVDPAGDEDAADADGGKGADVQSNGQSGDPEAERDGGDGRKVKSEGDSAGAEERLASAASRPKRRARGNFRSLVGSKVEQTEVAPSLVGDNGGGATPSRRKRRTGPRSSQKAAKRDVFDDVPEEPEPAQPRRGGSRRYYALRTKGRTTKGPCLFFRWEDLTDQIKGDSNGAVEWEIFDDLDAAAAYAWPPHDDDDKVEAASVLSAKGVSPAGKKKKTDAKRKEESEPKQRGDPRMNEALRLCCADQTLPLEEALVQGGFTYPAVPPPGVLRRELIDSDGIPLFRRKGQLAQRLKKLGMSNAVERRQRDDLRMTEAVRLCCEDPALPLEDALVQGGFAYPLSAPPGPGQSINELKDPEDVPLHQRKSILARRLKKVGKGGKRPRKKWADPETESETEEDAERMERAVQLCLEDSSLSLEDALVKGGFELPTTGPGREHLKDANGVTLSQRKGQLLRRLRSLGEGNRPPKRKRKATGSEPNSDEEAGKDGVAEETSPKTKRTRIPSRRKPNPAKIQRNKEWDDNVAAFRKHLEEHDGKYPSEGPLAEWVAYVRSKYKNVQAGKRSYNLDDEKIVQLDNMGFLWKSTQDQKSWEEHVEDFKKHKELFDGCVDPPSRSPLGLWVTAVRKQYKSRTQETDIAKMGKIPKGWSTSCAALDAEKIKLLEGLGFQWKDLKARKSFSDFVSDFRAYQEKYDSNDPPYALFIGRWCFRMRKLYRQLQKGHEVDEGEDGLDAEKIQELEEAGFNWKGRGLGPGPTITDEDGNLVQLTKRNSSPPRKKQKRKKSHESRMQQRWDAMYAQLKAYKEENGTCLMAGPNRKDSLSRWAYAQRVNYQRMEKAKADGTPWLGSLTEENVEKLKEVGFDFENHGKRMKDPAEEEANWEKMYADMKEYRAQNGNCIVSHTGPWRRLVPWIFQQRGEYKKIRAGEPSTLTAARIARLNDLDFVFETKPVPSWDERFNQLSAFKEQFGHARVPRNYEGEKGLGKWVAQQRVKYKHMLAGKHSTLTPERVQRLTDIGMTWSVLKSVPPEERAERKPWEERFQELLAFKAEHGHTVVPQHYPVLGSWVHTQRTHYKLMKKGKESLMNPERAFRLADIGFAFEVMPRKKDRIKREEEQRRSQQMKREEEQRRQLEEIKQRQQEEEEEEERRRSQLLHQQRQLQQQQLHRHRLQQEQQQLQQQQQQLRQQRLQQQQHSTSSQVAAVGVDHRRIMHHNTAPPEEEEYYSGYY